MAKKPKILLVEDDAFLVKAMLIKFEEAGFKVKTSPTAEEGQEILTKWRPDVVVLDILLPGQDGYSLLRTLRADPKLKDIPVIISSNLDERIGATPQADEYIVKSNLDLDELVTRIRSHIK